MNYLVSHPKTLPLTPQQNCIEFPVATGNMKCCRAGEKAEKIKKQGVKAKM